MAAGFLGLLLHSAARPRSQANGGSERETNARRAAAEDERIMLCGTVTDTADGSPVPDAIVIGRAADGREFKAASDSSGAYEVALRRAPAFITAHFQQGGADPDVLGSAEPAAIPEVDASRRVKVDLRMRVFRRVCFRGTVRDDRGASIRNANIVIEKEEGGPASTFGGRSDERGAYAFSGLLPLGSHELRGAKPRYREGSCWFVFSRWERGMVVNLDLVLAKLPGVEGIVRSPSGEAVAGANVVLTFMLRDEESTQWTWATAITDERGAYWVAWDGEGDAILVAMHPLYVTVEKRLGRARDAPAGLDVDLAFERMREGRYGVVNVLDEAGRPVVPRRVDLFRAAKTSRDPLSASHDPEQSLLVPAQIDGTFAMILERGHQYWIEVTVDGYESVDQGPLTGKGGGNFEFRVLHKSK